jgi:hypothetical protein
MRGQVQQSSPNSNPIGVNIAGQPNRSEVSSLAYKVTNKLLELGIWSGDTTNASIWNNNISDISDFKRDFAAEDIDQVISYKYKYISFRAETNSNFLCLGMMLHDLDEIFKSLFDFFKDTTENEFKGFEGQIIKAESLEDTVVTFY